MRGGEAGGRGRAPRRGGPAARTGERAPRSALPHRYLSNVHYLDGELRRAMRELEKALERNPHHRQDRENLKRLRHRLAIEALGT